MVTLGSALSYLSDRLAPHSETARLDTQVLLANLLGQSRTWIIAHPETELTSEQAEELDRQIRRLQNGVPLPYVLGHWEFFGRDFYLNPSVLIPRPETELLVEQALIWLTSHPDRRTACDLGTGSGCIAVSLATTLPNLHVLAIDISPQALQVARSNAQRYQLETQIDFLQNDLLTGVRMDFDLICANLPYIPRQTLHSLPVYGREPTLALDGGPDGLDLIRRMLSQAPTHLRAGGLLLAELEASQGEVALELARYSFPSASMHIMKDYAGQDRLLVVELI